MHRKDFQYDLPDKLIAKQPTMRRSDSRLLVLNGDGSIEHCKFPDLLKYLRPGDLMVFNNTKVMRARLFGVKETGGRLEVLIERIVNSNTALAHIRSSKPLRKESKIYFKDNYTAIVTDKLNGLFMVNFDTLISEILDSIGHTPLPPYIGRVDSEVDKLRYQTIYASELGAVAAPTAGLHFDEQLLNLIKSMDVAIGFVTLHVGSGTFQPVRVDRIKDHKMHSEWLEVNQKLSCQIRETRLRGGRVIAVGTTSARCLETAAKDGETKEFRGYTNIFIYPGYKFRVIDALITNFHLPESTLLMLVSAFAGCKTIKQVYREAISKGYRFYSYGDATFLAHRPNAD